jgi:hypothetical protein
MVRRTFATYVQVVCVRAANPVNQVPRQVGAPYLGIHFGRLDRTTHQRITMHRKLLRTVLRTGPCTSLGHVTENATLRVINKPHYRSTHNPSRPFQHFTFDMVGRRQRCIYKFYLVQKATWNSFLIPLASLPRSQFFIFWCFFSFFLLDVL